MQTRQKTLPIPFVKEAPVVGSLKRYQTDRLGFLTSVAAWGEVAGFHLGPLRVVAFNRPEFVQSLLVERANDFDKGSHQRNAFPGNGLFVSEGEFHRKQRQVIAPTFGPKNIKSFAQRMSSFTESIAQSWNDQEEIDLTKELETLATRIVGKTLFDIENFGEMDLCRSLYTIFNCVAYKITHPLTLWSPTQHKQRVQAWRVIRAEAQAIIEEHRSQRHDDILNRLIESGMNNEHIIDEVITLFGGGQETVASGLGWTWYLLSQHPDIYQAMQREVDTVLQGRAVTLDDLPHLPLCLQVLKETLRLYPPASVVIREALVDSVIESDDKEKKYLVKKGTLVMPSIYRIHRLAEYYPRPDSFDPALHFAPEAEKQRPRHAFMPFGAGPRVCIGNHFAMMEGHIIIATLAQRVTFVLPPGQHIEPSNRTLTTRPDESIKMIVQKRDTSRSSALSEAIKQS